MGVMSTLNTLVSGISHLLLRPHGDVSHLGGATTQNSSTQGATWDDSGWAGAAWLRWWTVRQGFCRFTFCAVALGQTLHDSDATLKPSCQGGRWMPSNQNTEALGDISQGTAAGLRQHANSLFLKGCLFSVCIWVCVTTRRVSLLELLCLGTLLPHNPTVFLPVTIWLLL